jgi:integrase
MASIRKHRGKWQVQIRRVGHAPVSRSFIQKSDAQAWARQIEQQIDRGDLVGDLRSLSSTTLRVLLERYRREMLPLKRGRRMESYKLDIVLRHGIADISLRRLTPSAIAAYRDDRHESVKPGTVRRELAILSHCFEVARREWDIPLPNNPVAQIKMPEAGRPRERRITAEELEAMLEGTAKSLTPLLAPIIKFAIETGMRRGEIVAARWADVNLTNKTLHIPQAKNGHARTIPLTPGALSVLHSLPQYDERVFPISGNAVRLAWERLKKRVGISDLRFHDLRHEAVSRFFEIGLSVPEVALISGHRDARMLFRYTHLRAEDIAMKLS